MKLNRDRRHRQPSPMDPSSAICVQAADIPTSLLWEEMKGGTAEPSEHVKRNARPTKSKDSTLEALRRSVDGDFYNIRQFVGTADQALLGRVRAFAEKKVAPIINQYWGRAEFPFEILPEYGALGIAGAPYSGFGCSGKSALLDGLIMMELARIDCSIATFHGVHSGLAMGSIYLCGSDEQKQ